MFQQPLPKKPTNFQQQQQLQQPNQQNTLPSFPSPFHTAHANYDVLQTPVKNVRRDSIHQTPKTLPANYYQNLSLTTPQSATPESPKKSASSKKCNTIPMYGKSRRGSPSELLMKNLFDENVPPSSFDIFADSESDLNNNLQDHSKKRKRSVNAQQVSYPNSNSDAMDTTNSDEDSPTADHIFSSFDNRVNVYHSDFQQPNFVNSNSSISPMQVLNHTPLYTLTQSPLSESSLKRMKML